MHDEQLSAALSEKSILLSINRFEFKKNVALAIKSFASVATDYADAVLIIAGGYDTRVAENVENLKYLESLASRLNLAHATAFKDSGLTIITALSDGARVIFAPSISSTTKDVLLERARGLLYTPTNEHFGIVPLEAMLVGTPVLATNTGGPLETVMDTITGWTRPDEQWADILRIILKQTRAEREAMSEACIKRVKCEFSLNKMAQEFESTCELATKVDRQSLGLLNYSIEIALCVVILAIMSTLFL
jgi:alpha-1,3/alpha-1,6-mannosyltransferase